MGSRFTMAIETNTVTRNLDDLGEPDDFGNRKISKTSPEDNGTPTAIFRRFSREGGSESPGCDAGKTLHPQGQGFITVPRYSHGHGY